MKKKIVQKNCNRSRNGIDNIIDRKDIKFIIAVYNKCRNIFQTSWIQTLISLKPWANFLTLL